MSQDPHERPEAEGAQSAQPLDASQERARLAIGNLSDAAPNADFRRELRKRFLAGPESATAEPPAWGAKLPPPPQLDQAQPFEDELPPPPEPSEQDASPQFERVARAPRRGLRQLPWAAILIAALTLLWIGSPADPGWRLMDVKGTGTIHVGNSSFVTADHSGLERRLNSGARVVVPATASLEIASAGNVLMHIAPGSEVILPSPRRMSLRRIWDGEVVRGTLRLSTGPDFYGTELMLTTPAGEVHVTGTTLAIMCGESDTCVCVLEGLVRLGEGGAVIEPGSRRTRFFPTGATLNETLAPAEAELLEALRVRAELMVEDEGY